MPEVRFFINIISFLIVTWDAIRGFKGSADDFLFPFHMFWEKIGTRNKVCISHGVVRILEVRHAMKGNYLSKNSTESWYTVKLFGIIEGTWVVL